MSDILKDMADLHVQATTEQSHYYTAKVLSRAMTEIRKLRLGVARRPLARLADEILEINRANGWKVLTPEDWHDENRVPTYIALLHSEVSEALEGFRHHDQENFAEELADVQIRLLDMAGGLGFDLDAEVRRKLDINRTRGFRHGGKKV